MQFISGRKGKTANFVIIFIVISVSIMIIVIMRIICTCLFIIILFIYRVIMTPLALKGSQTISATWRMHRNAYYFTLSYLYIFASISNRLDQP